MKLLKRMGIGIVCIPLMLIAVWILYEVVGAIANDISAEIQTNNLKKSILNNLSESEIIDTYSEAGNTSGTGNHVDILSAAVFKTDDTQQEIIEKLKDIYGLNDDGFGDFLYDLSKNDEYCKKTYNFYDELDKPDNMKNCYMICICESAPFADNINGH